MIEFLQSPVGFWLFVFIVGGGLIWHNLHQAWQEDIANGFLPGGREPLPEGWQPFPQRLKNRLLKPIARGGPSREPIQEPPREPPLQAPQEIENLSATRDAPKEGSSFLHPHGLPQRFDAFVFRLFAMPDGSFRAYPSAIWAGKEHFEESINPPQGAEEAGTILIGEDRRVRVEPGRAGLRLETRPKEKTREQNQGRFFTPGDAVRAERETEEVPTDTIKELRAQGLEIRLPNGDIVPETGEEYPSTQKKEELARDPRDSRDARVEGTTSRVHESTTTARGVLRSYASIHTRTHENPRGNLVPATTKGTTNYVCISCGYEFQNRQQLSRAGRFPGCPQCGKHPITGENIERE